MYSDIYFKEQNIVKDINYLRMFGILNINIYENLEF